MLAKRMQSTAISRIDYDEGSCVLTIWFRDGDRYLYFDVPRAIYDGLKIAPSAGQYFSQFIKGRFRFAFDPERRKFRPG